MNQTMRRFFLILLILIGFSRLALLSAYPLFDSTEGRYSRFAQEMVSTGNWVTPQYAPGIPFWGKPPLYFWTCAFSVQTFGLNEFAVRLPAFIFSLLLVLMTILLASRISRQRNGLIAGLILSSSALIYVSAGVVMTDTSLACSLALSMISIPLTQLAPEGWQKRTWAYLFFAGLGLSMLCKGPVAIVIAAVAVGSWALWKRQWQSIRRLPWATGTCLFLLISVPWHVMAEIRTPGFLRYYFVGEHLHRFLVPGWKSLYGDSHTAAFGMIWIHLLAAAFPWSIVITLHMVLTRRWPVIHKSVIVDSSWAAYLVCWALAPAVLFTSSRNIMMTYAMPSLAPIAILVFLWFQSLRLGQSEVGGRWSGLRLITALTLISPVIFTVTACALLPRIAGSRSQKSLVETFQRLDNDHDGELFYLSEMPDSAFFYSHGRAEDPHLDTLHAEIAEALEGHQLYFAARRKDLQLLPTQPRLRTELVAHQGKYFLYRTPDAGDLVR